MPSDGLFDRDSLLSDSSSLSERSNMVGSVRGLGAGLVGSGELICKPSRSHSKADLASMYSDHSAPARKSFS